MVMTFLTVLCCIAMQDPEVGKSQVAVASSGEHFQDRENRFIDALHAFGGLYHPKVAGSILLCSPMQGESS